MTTIIQLNQDELRAEIRTQFRELFEEIKSLPPVPVPDRLNLPEASELTRLSKSQIYKLTMLGEIPCQKFGRRLIFSRKQLLKWIDERTISAINEGDQVAEQLAKEAKKHLNK